MKQLLVFDGGRTNLRGVLLDSEGTIHRMESREGIRASLSDWQTVAQTLSQMGQKLARVSHPGDFKGEVSVGMAGLGRIEDRQDLQSALRGMGWKKPWHLESDAEQTLRAARAEGEVIIGILGTGSAFFARDKYGSVVRVGGHGYLLNDSGSGFELARKTLSEVYGLVDFCTPPPLLDRLLHYTDTKTADELIRWLYRDPFSTARIAGLSTVILQAASEGDSVAHAMMENEAVAVGKQIYLLVILVDLTMGTDIYLTGGLVQKNENYFRMIQHKVSERLRGHSVKLLERDAFWGGWEYLRQNSV